MEYQHIVVHDEGAHWVIEMNRPDRRNALSEAHLQELLDAFTEVETSKARGVILAARGPVFSAGHDFSDMVDRNLMETRSILSVCAAVMMKIQSIPKW